MPGEDREVRPEPAIDAGLLETFVAALKQKVRVASVVVFGSRATGENLRESDYDMLVLSPDFKGFNRFERVELLLQVWPGMVALEPVAMTPEEFAAVEGALIWDILEEGLVVLDDGTFEGRRRLHRERISSGSLRKGDGFWAFSESAIDS